MGEPRALRIFLSSPGDVSEERALAQVVFRRVAREVVDAVRLVVVTWEHEPIFAHGSMQDQIERPSKCDLVVSILWSRLGTRLPADYAASPGEITPTGTEFEIQDALQSFRNLGRPNLLIYRKVPGPEVRLGSPDYEQRSRQFEMLNDFCRRAFYDERGAIIVGHHQFSDSTDFESRLTIHVREWLDRQVSGSAPEAERLSWRDGSPFLGLEPFSAAHQVIFFGRSHAVSDIIQIIRETESMPGTARMLLVQGMSGTGKTSLMNAGVLPFLELRPVEGIARWLVISLRPTQVDPAMPTLGVLGPLATKLCDLLPGLSRVPYAGEKLGAALLERPTSAAERIEDALAEFGEHAQLASASGRLVIYIDQLEEVFTDAESASLAKPLFDALVALAKSSSIWIVAALRSDFKHRLEGFPELIACIAGRRTLTLLPPRAHELVDIIREPAKAAGLVWEKRSGTSLDQDLLRDASASPESLPLLEYTLAEIFQNREGRLLKWDAYRGGLKAALITAADSVVSEMGAEGGSFTAAMRELVSVNESGTATRRYAPLSRFPEGAPGRRFIDRLIARRLCVTTEGDAGPVVCLAHEALIDTWPLAREWLARESAVLRKRDELARDAALWVRHERQSAWLGAEPDKLKLIDDVCKAGLMPSGAAEDYARRSRRRAQRNSVIRRAAVAVICVLAIVAAVEWAREFQQRRITERALVATDRARNAQGYTAGVLVSLFIAANPDVNGGKDMTAKELLTLGVEQLKKADVRSPQVRADVLTAMGQSLIGIGDYKTANSILKDAIEAQRATLAQRSDLQEAKTLQLDTRPVSYEAQIRTLIASGQVVYRLGEYKDAVTVLQQAEQLARDHLARSDVLRSKTLAVLAEALTGGDDEDGLDRAVKLASEALEADDARMPVNDESRATLAYTLNVLGVAYFYLGELDAAEKAMRRALELRSQVFGKESPLTAECLANLGIILYQGGSYADALELNQKALDIILPRYTDSHPEVGSVFNNIARSLLIAGQVDKARPLFVRSVVITEKMDREKHNQLIPPLNSLSMIDAYNGDFTNARKWSERAEQIARETGDFELLDQVLLNRADIEFGSGHQDVGARMLEASWTQLVKAHPNQKADAWRYAVWKLVEAERLEAAGQRSDALAVLKDAREVIRARFPPGGLYETVADRRVQRIGSAKQDRPQSHRESSRPTPRL